MSEEKLERLREDIENALESYVQYMIMFIDLCGAKIEHPLDEVAGWIDLEFLESTIEWRHDELKECVIQSLREYEQENNV